MTLWRMLFVLAAAFAAGMPVKTLYEREKKLPQTLPGYSDGKDTRNTSHFDYLYLLLFIAVSAVMLLSERTQAQYSRLLTALIFEYLLVLSAYCLLLLLLLPALRRTISARACGRLWEIPAIVTFVILYLESIQNAAFVRLPMIPAVARPRQITSSETPRVSWKYFKTAGKTPQAPQVGAVTMVPPEAFCSLTA